MSALAVLFSLVLLSDPSRYISVMVDLDWNGSETETTVAYRAQAGDDGRFLRVTRDFDPLDMDVELLHASYGFPGAMREVPDLAIDTLTGSTGWPRALVVAFPGLRPGMDMEWTYRITNRGHFASKGLFYTYIAGNEPDTIIVKCDDVEGLSVALSGFQESEHRGDLVFTSIGEDYRELWLSTAEDWAEVEDILLSSSRESYLETPPDLREAAIEAGAAGALPRMRISRGRVLITESMQLEPFPGGDRGFHVRSIQEILDTRRATPIEAATLLSAMCRVMDIDAPVIPATDIQPPIPSPLGFFRAFILADGVLEEPSEYLSPAGWIDTPDTLWLLLPGGMLGELPPAVESDHCVENWTVNPQSGEIQLTVLSSGGFDRELRRKLAGKDTEELLLSISEWFRASNINFFPVTVETSDLFDLTEPASMSLACRMAPAGAVWLEQAPSLIWNREGTVSREYQNVSYENGMISR